MSSLYEAVSMPDPEQQIRLLRFESQKSEFDITYTLKTYNSNGDYPPYVGISYTWGGPEPTLPIGISGFVVRVRMNCWYALWQLRHHRVNSHLWIDTLSINQEDLAEKSVQVARMGNIFSNAASVAACIGSSSIIAELLSSAAQGNIDDQHDQWKELGMCDYWHRAWIRQEIVLAKEVRIYFGHQAVAWSKFMQCWWRYKERRASQLGTSTESTSNETLIYKQDAAYEAAPQLWQLLHQKWVQPGGQRAIRSPIQLIRESGNLRCEHARDKIYSMLSLLPPDDPLVQLIQPDYSQPEIELFVDLQCTLLKKWDSTTAESAIGLLSDITKWFRLDAAQPVVLHWLMHQDRGTIEHIQNGQTNYSKHRPPQKVSFHEVSPIAPFDPSDSSKKGLAFDFDFLFGDRVDRWRTSQQSILVPSEDTYEAVEAGPLKSYLENIKYQVLVAPRGFGERCRPASQRALPGPAWVVHEDVQASDVLVILHWFVEPSAEGHFLGIDHTFAILRPSGNALDRPVSYKLHSWAVPLCRERRKRDVGFDSGFNDTSYVWDLPQNPSLFSRTRCAVHSIESPEAAPSMIDLPAQQVTRFLLLNAEPRRALEEEEIMRTYQFDHTANAAIDAQVQRVLRKSSNPY